MWERIALGSTPCDEDCAQVGEEGYEFLALEECRRFEALIREKFGNPPPGAKLDIRDSNHDYGTYYEVVVSYDGNNEKAVLWALNVDENVPTNWDDI